MQTFRSELEIARAAELNSELKCPQCGTAGSSPVVELNNVPIVPNTAWTNEKSALAAALTSMCLVACSRCQLIYNVRFDKDLIAYRETYGNALHYSETFQRYSQDLVERLAARYGLSAGLVVEIGCGNGYFLDLLCQTADCAGVGFDPSSAEESETDALGSKVKIIAEEFSAQGVFRDADLICCRQVLEHIADPLPFLRSLRGAMGADSRAGVFVEVPNASFMLKKNSFWTLFMNTVSISPRSR